MILILQFNKNTKIYLPKLVKKNSHIPHIFMTLCPLEKHFFFPFDFHYFFTWKYQKRIRKVEFHQNLVLICLNCTNEKKRRVFASYLMLSTILRNLNSDKIVTKLRRIVCSFSFYNQKQNILRRRISMFIYLPFVSSWMAKRLRATLINTRYKSIWVQYPVVPTIAILQFSGSFNNYIEG